MGSALIGGGTMVRVSVYSVFLFCCFTYGSIGGLGLVAVAGEGLCVML